MQVLQAHPMLLERPLHLPRLLQQQPRLQPPRGAR